MAVDRTTINKVVDGALTLEVKDEKLQRALNVLNTNGDDQITVDDFVEANQHAEYVGEDVWREVMRHAVADVYVKAGAIHEDQREGFIGFLLLYNDMITANRAVTEWKENSTDTWGSEMEFKSDYYVSHVLPFIANNGVLSKGGSRLNYASRSAGMMGLGLGVDFLYVLRGLSQQHIESPPIFGKGCGGFVRGFKFNEGKIPNILKSKMEKVYQMYTGIRFLLGGYRDVECEGEGCPELDEFSIYMLDVLKGSSVGYIRTILCKL